MKLTYWWAESVDGTVLDVVTRTKKECKETLQGCHLVPQKRVVEAKDMFDLFEMATRPDGGRSYADFRGRCWAAIERVSTERFKRGEPHIPFVKRRAVVALWLYYERKEACKYFNEDLAIVGDSNLHVLGLKGSAVDPAIFKREAEDHMSRATALLEKVETSLTQTVSQTKTENIIMTKAFETTVINTVYGKDIKNLGVEGLIEAINKVDNEITSLSNIQGSKKVDSMVVDLKAQRQLIVDVLDAK